MPIDFFNVACQNQTQKDIFGLCDDEDVPPVKTPAYLDETDSTKWIAEVHNSQTKQVIFTAIDHCIENIVRANGDNDNKCDCTLTYDDAIMFVELKDRQSGGWVRDGINQLSTTIQHFKDNTNIGAFQQRHAQIANKAKPLFSNSYREILQKFKDDTGFNLSIKKVIEI